MKLNFEALQILMGELQQNQLLAIYLMGFGREITDTVTKVDFTIIIKVLCKKLNWIEEHEDSEIEDQVLSAEKGVKIDDKINLSDDNFGKTICCCVCEQFINDMPVKLWAIKTENKLPVDHWCKNSVDREMSNPLRKNVSQTEDTNCLDVKMKHQDSENVNSEVIKIKIEDEMPSETVRENIVTLQRLKQNKENSKPI